MILVAGEGGFLALDHSSPCGRELSYMDIPKMTLSNTGMERLYSALVEVSILTLTSQPSRKHRMICILRYRRWMALGRFREKSFYSISNPLFVCFVILSLSLLPQLWLWIPLT